MIDLLLICGSVSWITTVLVKDLSGPFNILNYIRNYINKILKDNSPLKCFICTGFWVSILILILNQFIPDLIYFLGIVGLSMILRGMSNEY